MEGDVSTTDKAAGEYADDAERLVESGPGEEVTAVAEAVFKRDLEALQYLLENGLEINKDDPEHPNYVNTLLQHAIYEPKTKGKGTDLEMVKYLIEAHGANPSFSNSEGYNLLIAAAYHGHWDVVSYLNGGTGFPLHEAAASGDFKTVQSLIETGDIPIDSCEHIEFTPLQLASDAGHSEVVAFLIEKGADITATNFHASVLHFAACSENTDCLLLILKALKNKFSDNPELRKTHLNAPDYAGDTPLMWAIELESIEIAQILLDYGADPEIKNKKGEIARDIAERTQNSELLKLLSQRAENVDVPKTTIGPAVSIDDLSENLAHVILGDAKDDMISKTRIGTPEPVSKSSNTVKTEQKDNDYELVLPGQETQEKFVPRTGEISVPKEKGNSCCSIA